MVKLITGTNGIVRIMAIWALILGILNLANSLILTLAVDLETNQDGNQMRIWLGFGMGIVFGVGFFLSAYGLWTHQNWGRTLFLWIITTWAVFTIIGLVLSMGQYEIEALIVNIARYVVTLLIPLWYLHRPEVKALFEQNKNVDLERL
jgi:hypothetical protein